MTPSFKSCGLVGRCFSSTTMLRVRFGSSASSWRRPRYVRFSPITAEKADIPVRLGTPHQLRNRQNEPSFTLVLVQSGSIPKAIEFVLNPPADVPPA
jgi:hypothetical protein